MAQRVRFVSCAAADVTFELRHCELSEALSGRPDRFHELAIRAANHIAVSAPAMPRLLPLPKVRPHRKFRDLEGGTGGKRHDIDKIVARLAIDRKCARLSVRKALSLDDIFHSAVDALDRSFQVFVDQCSQKIHALLASKKPRRITARGSALRVLVLRHRNDRAGERTVGLSQLIQNRKVISIRDRYQVPRDMAL